MKKIILASALMLMSLFEGCITTTVPVSASTSMSTSKIRNHARFLTDRMAYELDLSPMQYSDCYEINYDFIYYVSRVMEDVAHGYYDAINTYYLYLDYRNDDLRYVLTANQYVRFMSKEYFYRPIYTSGNSWNFRVYTIYSNTSFYYYDAPPVFKDYRGGHGRTAYSNGYYVNRYTTINHFTGSSRITGSNHFNDHRRNDFGTNLRDRNQKPDYNNYNNRNSNNRTADPRYRDNSGNQHSPLINGQTGEHRGQSTQPQGNTGSRSNTTTGTNGNSTSRSGASSRSAAYGQQQGTTTGARTNTSSTPTNTQNNTSTPQSSRGGQTTTSSRGGQTTTTGTRGSSTTSSRGGGAVGR